MAIHQERWSNPEMGLPEPARFFPLGLNRPTWAVPVWIMTALMLALTLRGEAGSANFWLNLLLICLPLGAASAVAWRGWQRGTFARREYRRGAGAWVSSC